MATVIEIGDFYEGEKPFITGWHILSESPPLTFDDLRALAKSAGKYHSRGQV